VLCYAENKIFIIGSFKRSREFFVFKRSRDKNNNKKVLLNKKKFFLFNKKKYKLKLDNTKNISFNEGGKFGY
jgi:hypothetical protein